MGAINFTSSRLMRQDRAPQSYQRLVYAAVHLIFGLSSLLANSQEANALRLMGLYTIFIGLTYVHDGRAAIIDSAKETNLRRHIRIPLPSIFTAFLPQRFLVK